MSCHQNEWWQSYILNEAVCRLLEDYNRYLQQYGMLRVKHPLPGSCRQKTGKVEGVGSLPVGHQLIECSTSLTKTEACMHYWIKQIPLLIEKLVAICEAQGKFETSIEFSRLINKIYFGIGSDRGGGDVIDLIRLINRIAGNCARYSIPMSVVEKATEDYDVLAKTIYNKRTRQLLQPILSDELCMFTMRFKSDVKCLSIRFIRDGQPVVVSRLSLF